MKDVLFENESFSIDGAERFCENDGSNRGTFRWKDSKFQDPTPVINKTRQSRFIAFDAVNYENTNTPLIKPETQWQEEYINKEIIKLMSVFSAIKP